MDKNVNIIKIFKIILLIFFLAFSSRSQNKETPKGVISGKVINASTLEPLPGVNVTIIGTLFGAITDINGRFSIKDINPGTYSIRASLLGFSQVVKSDILVNPVRPTYVEFNLSETPFELGEVSITAEYFQKSPDVL